MSIQKILNDIKDNAGIYLIILAIIVISDDCYWFSTAANKMLISVKYGFFVVFPLFIYMKFGQHKIKIASILTMTLLFSMSAFCGGASLIGGPITLFFLLLSSSIFVSAISLDTFSRAFIKVNHIIMIYSLLVWILVMLGFVPITEVENIAGATVKTAYLCTFFSDYFGMILRNGSIFREPGVFMVFINIAFLIDIVYLKNRLNIKKLVLYVGCMFTTLSTAGLIILLCAYTYYIYIHKTNIKTMAIPVAFMGICLYFLMGSEELIGDIFAKLDRGMESGSVAGRITSLTIPAMIIVHNPILGVGAEMFRNEYIKYGKEMYHMYIDPQGLSTNTILNAGAVYGLWFAVFIVINFYLFSNILVRGKKNHCLYIFLLFMMMFSNESMFYSLIVYILLFYGMNARKNIK